MKKLLSIVFIFLLFVIFVVYQTVDTRLAGGEEEFTRPVELSKCGAMDGRGEMFALSELSSIRKLGELDSICSSSSGGQLMVFVNMPKDDIVAKKMAEDFSKVLFEFDKNGISPIVIVEPDSAWGLIDFSEFNTGFWDKWIDTFFVELKQAGVSREQMGIWVPFPEANLPLWNHQNAAPRDYSLAVNRYMGLLKKHYPDVEGSVLLNSATYATDDFDWSDGDYLSLKPYVEGLNPEYIKSFGIQGFPWVPPLGREGRAIDDAREFINHPLVDEAAEILGTKKVWINTGTFAAKYANGIEGRVLIPSAIRKQTLNTVLSEVRVLQDKGYEVTVNIFAEDKSTTPEGTDWSYWGSQFTGNPEHRQVFSEFLRDLNASGITTSFFFK